MRKKIANIVQIVTKLRHLSHQTQEITSNKNVVGQIPGELFTALFLVSGNSTKFRQLVDTKVSTLVDKLLSPFCTHLFCGL